jgi:hypothetical protein
MAQIGSAPVVHKRGAPASDIYTVLALVAVLALAIGVGFVWMRSNQLFGTSNPFEVTRAGNATVGR